MNSTQQLKHNTIYYGTATNYNKLLHYVKTETLQYKNKSYNWKNWSQNHTGRAQFWTWIKQITKPLLKTAAKNI